MSTVWMAHPQARNDVRPTVAPNSFSEDKTSKAKPDQQLELLNTSVADGRQTTEKVSQAAEDGLEPLDQIAGGLRPLADTLDVAWETFCRSIADPVERAQAMQDDPPPFEWSLWPVSAS